MLAFLAASRIERLSPSQCTEFNGKSLVGESCALAGTTVDLGGR